MVRLNFIIDDELHKKFKKYCIDENKSMTKILIEAIKNMTDNEKLHS